jgi:hypothetical protein
MGVAAKMGVISSSMLVRKQMNVVPAIARTSCNRKQHFTVKHFHRHPAQILCSMPFSPEHACQNPDVGAMLDMHQDRRSQPVQ